MKINVLGCSGTGKTTFSRALSKELNIQCIEMDRIFWKKNWEESNDEEFFEALKQALESDSWVLDGNYTRTIPIKWKNVDMVIWLDYSFPITFYRSVKRAFIRSLFQKELWPGTNNRESFRKSFFSRDSIILWMLTSFFKVRKKGEGFINSEKYSHIQFIRLKNPHQAQRFIKKGFSELKNLGST